MEGVSESIYLFWSHWKVDDRVLKATTDGELQQKFAPADTPLKLGQLPRRPPGHGH